jgi:hypothetical protein
MLNKDGNFVRLVFSFNQLRDGIPNKVTMAVVEEAAAY